MNSAQVLSQTRSNCTCRFLDTLIAFAATPLRCSWTTPHCRIVKRFGLGEEHARPHVREVLSRDIGRDTSLLHMNGGTLTFCTK